MPPRAGKAQAQATGESSHGPASQAGASRASNPNRAGKSGKNAPATDVVVPQQVPAPAQLEDDIVEDVVNQAGK